MRLLHLDDNDNISLVERFGENVPPYAILSHTWGQDNEELTFKDLIEGTGKNRVGYRKLMFCGKQAMKDSLHYFWVDTVCIDKSSSTELQEALNSMFRWYQGAEKCYVYLTDVSTRDVMENLESFKRSRWFTRGWTLQELIAPTSIEFYSVEGDSIGDKASLMEVVHSVTRIPVEVLQGSQLSSFSIEERMSWAKDRNTKREEDAAYSLLGIFGVHMPLIYGEGREHAISRLRRKINKLNRDNLSTPNPSATSIEQTDLESRSLSLVSRDRECDNGSLPKNVSNSYTAEIADTEWTMIDHGELQVLKDFCDQVEGIDVNTPPCIGLNRSGSNSIIEENPRQLTTPNLISQDQVQRESIEEIQRLLPILRYQADMKELAEVNDWLDVTRFNDQYNIAQFYDKQVSSRLENTCEWIFSHPAYCRWISEKFQELAKILWIYAPAGHGKSVLCARVVQHLETMQSKITAYFFASPHAQSGGTPEFIVRSWIAQMAQHDADVIQLVKSSSKLGQRASDSAVWSMFASIISSNRSYVFVLDGFDEYSRTDNARSRFLQKLKKSVNRTRSRILITSRNETDIDSELSEEATNDQGITVIRCKITNDDVGHDISLFSKSLVDERLPRKDERFRQELAGQLAEKCESMFLWIKMQQDQLRGGKNTKQLQNIVNNMPAGLTKTYERNWNTIQNLYYEDRINALTILKWVTFAFRPLRVLDIAQALVIDYNEGVPTLRQDDLPDEIDEDYINGEILDICAGLVEARSETSKLSRVKRTVPLIPAYKTLHLIHASVREFLLSGLFSRSTIGSRLVPISDQTTSHIEQHFEIATVCLGYLSLLEVWPHNEECGDRGHKHSFACYAATHWNLHVIAAGQNNPELLRQMRLFFRSEDMAFRRWCRYMECVAGVEYEYEDEEDEPYDNLGTPFYYAALLNLTILMEEFWMYDKTQLNRVGGAYGTPLQAVCFKGHQLAFELLIKWGADPTVECGKFGFAIHAAIAGGNDHIVESLLSSATNYNLQDSKGRTLLFTAAFEENLRVVRLLLEAGADQNLADEDGYTPIHIVAEWGPIEVVDLLLEWGADTTIPSKSGYTPLDSAVYRNQLDIVKLLTRSGMTHTQVNSIERTGSSLLHLATGNGNLELMNLFLDNGADLSAFNERGSTPLYTAILCEKLEAATLLLEKGADVEVSADGNTRLLSSAAASGNIELVKLLLQNGAMVEPNDVSSATAWTPLMAAANRGHIDIMEFLLENGANIAATNQDKETPLSLAASCWGSGDAVEFLLDRGADWSVVDSENRTVLWKAANWKFEKIVKVLLDRGMEWTVADSKGRTPLWAAARSGNANIVKLFLDKDADWTTADTKGRTPLWAAARSGDVETVERFLDKGADWTTADIEGHTPLWAAANYGRYAAVKSLLDQRTDLEAADADTCAALNVVARYGRLDIAELLLEKGAIMYADSDGYTPLNRAAEEGHLETVRLLLKHGADMTADSGGWTPLNNAANKGHLEVVELLLEVGAQMDSSNNGWTPLISAANRGRLEIFKLLLENGASTTTITHDGWTALSAAADSGHLEIVRNLFDVTADFDYAVPRFGSLWHVFAYQGYTDLLKLGYQEHHADFNLVNSLGQTCFHMAAMRGHVETIQYFLSLGLELPNDDDAKGDSLLSYASLGRCLDIVKIVLESSPKVPRESKNWTPLHWACRRPDKAILELLIEAGFRGKCVAVSQPEAKWSPASVAIFHNYSWMLEELSEPSRTLLSAEGEDEIPPGQSQNRNQSGQVYVYVCDGCFHVIHGPRFRCNMCPAGIEYCFMCKPFLGSLPIHDGHEWTAL